MTGYIITTFEGDVKRKDITLSEREKVFDFVEEVKGMMLNIYDDEIAQVISIANYKDAVFGTIKFQPIPAGTPISIKITTVGIEKIDSETE